MGSTQQVLKIKYKDTFRRINFPPSSVLNNGFSYEDLEGRIRRMFQIPIEVLLIITYTDEEGDVITMTDSQDLNDVCLIQKQNPLKIEVKTVSSEMETEANDRRMGPAFAEFNVEVLLKGLFPGSITKTIDEVLSRYPSSLFTTVPAHVLPEALDTFLGTLVAHSAQNAAMLQRGDCALAPAVAVHKFIECDVCFMCPIVGPRYKSIKKHDYDLCSNCFEKFGKESDYRRLDRPLMSGLPSTVETENCAFSSACKASGTPGSLNCVLSISDSVLLDAEFVMDVTVPDGSKVEVGTSFTKIWRLKNCGAISWPELTKLAHIGGDLLGSNGAVTLQLSEGGLSSNSEVDVSVELKAPENPGRYMSNWHLQAPSGQPFGQSVWVLIEAIPVFGQSQMTHELRASCIDKKLKDCPSDEPQIRYSSSKDASDSKKGAMKGLSLGEESLKTDCLSLSSIEEPGKPDGFSLGENKELGDESEASEEFELISSHSHESLSSQFEIKQNDSNLELEQNRFSVDYSSAPSGWDHMSKDLEELGFHDTQTNIKELAKLEKEMSGKVSISDEISDLKSPTPARSKMHFVCYI